MNRNEARAYFEAAGLSYRDITILKLQMLAAKLNEAFARQEQGFVEKGITPYWRRVNDAKYFKGRYEADGTMRCAFLTARGGYFNAREVVSFNEDGFIGFCGEAADSNALPVLETFVAWCDWLKEEKK